MYPFTTWRLLHTPPADGATNMALDEALLMAVAQQASPPTLRFFGWTPPCLSLGYAQPIRDVDRERWQASGWGLVRRPTGGRAILHTDELTYSVIAPRAEPRVAGGVIESYRQLSAGLLGGLARLGLTTSAEKEHSASPASAALNPICFEVPSSYEITVGGKKLLGSAQLRKQGVVLQHGTLPLTGDLGRICEVLHFDSEEHRAWAKTRVYQRATTLAEALGRTVTWAEAAAALQQGFSEALNLEFELGGLTPQEEIWARECREAKYATEKWTGLKPVDQPDRALEAL